MDAKPLIIVIIFVLILAVIASGIIGNVDLTDSGTSQQPLLSNQPAGGSGATNPGIMAGSGAGASSSLSSGTTGGGQPVTGKSTSPLDSPCGSTYIVKSGDTLSSISRTCLISIVDLLAVNPSITNQNVIAVGQTITIYHTNTNPNPYPGPNPLPVVTQQPTAAQVTQIPTSSSGVVLTLPEGMNPGDPVNIEMVGLPANAQVRVGLDRTGRIPTTMKTYLTDANGVLKTTLTIPDYALADETWTVTVRTVGAPRMQVTAVPFTIKK